MAVMSRDCFMNIRSSLKFFRHYEPNLVSVDPSWHIHYLLEHFERNAASVIVPVGVIILDENTARCEGHTNAQSYTKLNPVKLA